MPTSKQERERARRKLQEQLEQRRAAEARRRKTAITVTVVATVAVIAVVVGLIIGLSGGSKKTPVASGSSGAASSAAPAGYVNCDYAQSGTAVKAATPPDATEPDNGTVTMTVNTSQGAMTWELDRSVAPCSVGSLVSLATQKYYDSTPCHRLVTSGIFVLQCGDPGGTGSGGPGYTVPDEATGSEQYPAGTIAMARTQAANSTGSQFFIVYQDSPSLQQSLGAQQYTVIGKVTAGLDVVTKVAAAGSDDSNGTGDGKPKLPIDITTMVVDADTSTSAASPSDGATDSTAPSATPPAGETSPAGTGGSEQGSPISS